MPVLRTLLVLLVFNSFGFGAELRTLAGKTLTGQVVAVSDKEVEIATATGTEKVPVAQVLDVVLQPARPVPPDAKRCDFELTDGSRVHVKPDGITLKGKTVELALLTGQTIKVELKYLANYIKDAQDPKVQAEWKTILRRKVKTDRVVILREGKPITLDGTFGESADDKGEAISFKLVNGKTLNLDLSKVYGMVFYRPEANPTTTLCQLYDLGGNHLVAHKLVVDGAGFKVTTVTGAELQYDKTAVARLDYYIGKLNFLSDLEPAKVVERSGSGLVTRYRKDHNLDDGPIRIDGKTYPKGLALHAYTELEYDLGGKYKELTAVLGVDDEVGGDSKALVTIECDDTKVFSQEVNRKTVKPLILKVKDVNKLRIVVSSRNVLDLHDHVTLANAKVSQ